MEELQKTENGMEFQRVPNPDKKLPPQFEQEQEEEKTTMLGKLKNKFSMESIMLSTFEKYIPKIKEMIIKGKPKGIAFMKGEDQKPKFDWVKCLELMNMFPSLKPLLVQCEGDTNQAKLEDLFWSVILRNEAALTAYMNIHHKRIVVIELDDSGEEAIVQIHKAKYLRIQVAKDDAGESLSLEDVQNVNYWIDKMMNVEDMDQIVEMFGDMNANE